MTRLDPLADALSKIESNEFVGETEVIIYPASKQVAATLRVMQKEGYVGEFEFIDDGREGKFRIQLLGRINRCRVVKPRYPIKLAQFEKWEKQFLPAKNFGILVLSTPRGFMSHTEARKIHTGGRIIAYIY